jgi:hypothetical protein
MTRRRSLAVVAIAAAGTVALAAGIAQGSSGSDGDTQVATIDAAVAAADVRLCPGAAPVAQLDPGDTVALTGRSEDGAWLQLRSPADEDERVWIDATLVVVTTTPEDLPIVRCGAVDLAIELIGGGELVLTPKTTTTTTTSTTTPPAGGATTTTAGGTTTSGPGDDPTTTATSPPGGGTSPTPTTSPRTPTTTRPRTTTTQRPTTTTTTAPPDRTAPTIDTFGVTRTLIWETGGPTCVSPQQVQPSVRVRDASGIARVRIIYQIVANIDGAVVFRGNDAMSLVSGDLYRANLGPFNQPLPNGTNGYLTWQVLATDGSPAANEVIVSSGTDVRVQIRNC